MEAGSEKKKTIVDLGSCFFWGVEAGSLSTPSFLLESFEVATDLLG